MIANEKKTAGTKGTACFRSDKRIKRWLLAKRPLPSDVDRIISYRTESCVAYNDAERAGETQEVLDFLWAEHAWALKRLGMVCRTIVRNIARRGQGRR